MKNVAVSRYKNTHHAWKTHKIKEQNKLSHHSLMSELRNLQRCGIHPRVTIFFFFFVILSIGKQMWLKLEPGKEQLIAHKHIKGKGVTERKREVPYRLSADWCMRLPRLSTRRRVPDVKVCEHTEQFERLANIFITILSKARITEEGVLKI